LLSLSFIFNPLTPLIGLLHGLISYVNGFEHSYGWTMVTIAVIVKLIFWPLNERSIKAMHKTQQMAPKISALKSEFKGSPAELNVATMALYKAEGTNPLFGCLPMLAQLPIIIGLFWAISADKATFATQSWLWIGSPFAAKFPGHVFATSLAGLDFALLALYVASMFLSVRMTNIAPDPQARQQQQLMSLLSPAMTAFFGIRYAWPSALLIYWLVSNLIAIFQQVFVTRKLNLASNKVHSMTKSPAWVRVMTAYVLFFLGRGYSPDVRVSTARWIAWGSMTSSIFAIAVCYGFFTTPTTSDDRALSLLFLGVTVASLYTFILKITRRTVVGF